MCGIAGIFRTATTVTVDDVSAIQRMLRAQRHRGPDGEGLVALGVTAPGSQSALFQEQGYPSLSSAPRVILGHRRLAIVDLSDAARQPMSNEDGTVWISYNGEIYNFLTLHNQLKSSGHTFHSQTDTEVLLHGYEEWGIDGLLSRLQGMFAFALYDARQRHDGGNGSPTGLLLLVRDRLGIKPLYYADLDNGEGIVFASEVKALRASRTMADERDRDALTGFLLFGAIPAPHTILKRISCVPAGHYLVMQDSGMTLHQYWQYWDVAPAASDRTVTTGDIGRLLEVTTAQHLLSDVPLGVFLSGGVDSAGLVALAQRAYSSTLRTLTVTYTEEGGGEAREAQHLAAHFGTSHSESPICSADFLRELPTIFAALDQPTHDGVNTYFVAKAARAAGLTVALSGLGADEVFWGYRHYRWLAKQPERWLTALPQFLRYAVANGTAAYGRLVGQERWQRFAYLNGGPMWRELYLLIRGFFAPEQIQQLLGLSSAERDTLVEQWLPSRSSGREGMSETQIFNDLEMQRYLHDQLLRDADVFGMTHSVEIRVPYLDHTVVEAVQQVPPTKKIHPRENKPVLVHALSDTLVRQASRKPKRGFTVPMQSWMQQYADELQPIAEQTTDLNRATVRQLWREFRNGRLHWSRAWALVVLGARG